MIPEQYLPYVASVFVFVVGYVLFYEGMLHKIDEWDWLRQLLPYVDDEAREVGFYTSYTLSEAERVGVLDMNREQALDLFDDLGFLRAPLAAHKEDWKGRREVASLGWYGRHGDEIIGKHKLARFLLMAFVIRKQLHVTLFERDDGRIVVTAHYEYSPYNVFKAFDHLIGEGLNVEKGVQMTRDKISETGVLWHGT